MLNGRLRRVALLVFGLAVATFLSACGGGSGTAETTRAGEINYGPRSGERATAWNHVNVQLRHDILQFGKIGSGAELEQAAAVVRAYLIARASGDAEKSCTLLSKYMLVVVGRMAKHDGKPRCVSGVEKLSKLSTVDENKRPGQIEPTRIRRHGQRAFVIYKDSYGDTYAMLMRPERDGWKIQGFEPTRLS